jgi:cytochrome c biogenesis protein CcmG/thiol:disulfide interchange protein DsbE
MKRMLAIGLGAVILIIAAVSIFSLNRVAQAGKRPVVGSPAPTFDLPLYPAYRADLPEAARLAELKGKVVVINFWASWCLECRKEAPDLEAQYRAYKDRGVVFIGVDYLDTEKAAMQYLKEFDITYPNGIDIHEKIAKAYRITGVPETFIVDQEGIIRYVEIQRITAAKLTSVLDSLLGKGVIGETQHSTE